MADEAIAKVFFSGGSQAVRLPKAMRIDTREVRVRKRGRMLVLEPIADRDDWNGFWDQLVELRRGIKRWKTRPAERRKPL